MIITNEIREIWGEASRAGVTKDSIGQELNVAERAARQDDTDLEIRHLKRALEIHNTWGARLPSSYAMAERTLKQVTDRLAELTPDPEPEPQAPKSPAHTDSAPAENPRKTGTMHSKNRQKLARIAAQVRRWDLAVITPEMPKDSVTETRRVVFANANHGAKGGRLRNVREYSLNILEMMTLAEMVAPRRLLVHKAASR